MKRYVAVQRGIHELAIINKVAIGTRILGIPFLITGFYLYWGAYLVVASHARAGSLGAPMGYLPIVIFLLLFGSIFTWPGVLFSLTFRTVSLWANPRRVVELVWRGPFRRERQLEITERSRIFLKHVVKTSPTGGSSKNAIAQRRNFFAVEIAESATDKAAVNLCCLDTLAEAQELGTKLALFSGMKVIDATKAQEDTGDEELPT